MKLETVRYEPAHLKALLAHPSQALVRKYVKDEDCEALNRHEYAYTVLRDGEPIACIGLIRYWEGRYEAWAFLIPGHRDVFVYIHNQVRRFLKLSNIRRIEATVDMGFKNGHKWALMLGFHVEAPLLQGFGPTGNDHRLYVFLREGK